MNKKQARRAALQIAMIAIRREFNPSAISQEFAPNIDDFEEKVMPELQRIIDQLGNRLGEKEGVVGLRPNQKRTYR